MLINSNTLWGQTWQPPHAETHTAHEKSVNNDNEICWSHFYEKEKKISGWGTVFCQTVMPHWQNNFTDWPGSTHGSGLPITQQFQPIRAQQLLQPIRVQQLILSVWETRRVAAMFSSLWIYTAMVGTGWAMGYMFSHVTQFVSWNCIQYVCL